MFGNEKVSRRRTLIVRTHYLRDKSTVVRAADEGAPLVGTFQFSGVLGDGPIRVHFHRLYGLAENVPMNMMYPADDGILFFGGGNMLCSRQTFLRVSQRTCLPSSH